MFPTEHRKNTLRSSRNTPPPSENLDSPKDLAPRKKSISLGDIGSPKLPNLGIPAVNIPYFVFDASIDSNPSSLKKTAKSTVSPIKEIQQVNITQSPLLKNKMNAIEIQNLVEKRIPMFYGHPGVEVSEVQYFLDAIKRLSAKVGTEAASQAALAEELIERLRGRAYEVVRDGNAKTANEISTLISRNFLPTHSIEFLSTQLSSAKQKLDETCLEFGNRIQNYANEYETGVRYKYGNEHSIPKPLLTSMEQEAFVKGLLNPTIRTHLLMFTDKTTTEIIQMATKLEACLGYSKELTPTNYTQRCQLCDKEGHLARSCPENNSGKDIKAANTPQNLNKDSIFESKSGANKANSLWCRYCKRKGHTIQECRTKIYVMAGQQALQQQRNNYIPVTPKTALPAITYRGETQQNPNFYQNPRNNTNQLIKTNWSNRENNFNSRIARPNGFPNYQQQRPPGRNPIAALDDRMRNLSINYLEHQHDYDDTEESGNDYGLAESLQ